MDQRALLYKRVDIYLTSIDVNTVFVLLSQDRSKLTHIYRCDVAMGFIKNSGNLILDFGRELLDQLIDEGDHYFYKRLIDKANKIVD